ncbi:hypothetical protein H072_1138 [Dactylellina haptotyla CBS 200.50]|uniref:Carrier domain-containing protein n=1 Tax=Dactylellina haptotyla (strain CBS 200.50) TaxID=1284197 RepID=S8CB11_DACHA|nr:hypothetical protein H072_1138 [Dactylellina haptotyla CBS 200.50]
MSAQLTKNLSTAVEPFSLFDNAAAVHGALMEIESHGLIPRSSILDLYPCTPMQEGFMALSAIEKHSYICQYVFELHLNVNLERLKEAWRVLEESCELLRTRIAITETLGTVQLVTSKETVWKETKTLEEYQKWDSEETMDFEEPLSRCGLADNGKYFIWTAHHAIADAFSMNILFRELKRIYGELSNSSSSHGSTIVPFRYFVHDQISTDAKATESYWRKYLADCPSSAYPKVNSTTPHKSSPNQMISDTLTIQRAGGSKIKTSTIATAAWAVAMGHYTQSDDIIFGTISAGRKGSVQGVRNMAGPTLTTFPIRITLDPTQSVTSLLESIQADGEHRVPYEQVGLRRIAQMGPDGRKASDLRNLFVVQLPHKVSYDQAPLPMKIVSEPTYKHPYPLMMICIMDQQKLTLEAHYDDAVMSSNEIRGLLNHYMHIVQQLAEAESSPRLLQNVDLFTMHDRMQVQKWNGIPLKENYVCLHELFEMQAKMQPDASAISAWDDQFTYRELDEISNKLAAELMRIGAGPEKIVPVCFSKSAWTLVSLLAVLKSGAACMAMDASHPLARLQAIAADTKAEIIVAGPEHVELCKSLVPLVVPVTPSFVQNLPNVGRVRSQVRPNNRAFTLFTSGSTGTPKGMEIEHRAISTSLLGQCAIYGIGPDTRRYQFSGYSFDASMADMFCPLISGGCVCIPSDHDRINDLAGSINSMKANQLCMTPSVIGLLDPSTVPTIQSILLGGEAMTHEIIQKWAGRVRLFNVYGPSECSIISSTTENKVDAPKSKSTCIGYALGCRNWVVDPQNHNVLAPIGSIGELMIEGPIVARGYLGRPEQTAASFIENPSFLQADWGYQNIYPRVYKTGDLVRYDVDGTLIFVGRKDTQVKYHGQRIELADIEENLRGSKYVQNCMALVPKAGPHSGQLVAILELNQAADSSADVENDFILNIDIVSSKVTAIRSYASANIPPYMLPTVYLVSIKLPLNKSGKLDRLKIKKSVETMSKASKELLSLSATSKNASATNSKPATTGVPATRTEEIIRNCFARVLNRQPSDVPLDQSFVRLGGDSISAMELVPMCRREGVIVTAKDVLQCEGISDLATRATSNGMQVGSNSETNSDHRAVTPYSLLSRVGEVQDVLSEVESHHGIARRFIADIYPCTPLQESLMALTKMQKNAYVTQMVLPFVAQINVSQFQAAWERVVARNDILRTKIIQSPRFGSLQIVLKNANTSLSNVADRLDGYLAADKQIPFDYGASLWRAAIVTEGKQMFFVCTMHHSVYDGWSLPLMLQQLVLFYDGKSISPFSTRFSDFVKYLEETNDSTSERFWRGQLEGYQAKDFPARPLDAHHTRQSQTASFPISFTKHQGKNTTIATLIRAAWAFVVSQYSESSDVAFGMTMSGRNAPVDGIMEMVGPTITTVPVRIQLQAQKLVSEFLEAVQAQATNMIPYEHKGLQNIGRMGQDCKSACDFQNLLVIQTSNDQKSTGNIFGPAIIPADFAANFTSYPLVVEANLGKSAINLEISFDANTISRVQVERLMFHFSRVFEILHSAPASMKVSDIDMFSSHDRMQIEEWNKEYPETLHECIHEVIQKHAHIRPFAEAVYGWDRSFTYAELDLLSSQLAEHLVRNFSIGAEKFVPILFEKSAWVVVAIMGVLKAGAAFVPLDINHPRQRLEEIIGQVDAKVVLATPTTEKLLDRMMLNRVVISGDFFEKGSYNLEVAPTGVESARLDRPSTIHLHQRANPRTPAYTIFTSGSTGKPKGVVIEHGAICSGLVSRQESCNLSSETRTLQFSSFSFDVSVEDILAPLAFGGCVCIPSEEERLNNISGFIRESRANSLATTPSFASTLNPGDVPSLRYLRLGGERLTSAQVSKWAGVLSLKNCYGPTETCISATLSEKVSFKSDPSNIGKGIGTVTWIVNPDDANRLTPLGMVGELLLEGPLLARGYLNDEEKTRNSFIINPKWAVSGRPNETRRFYKTGDLVRYSANGDILYIGRKDTQVKLHGLRIELGEIEHHISQHIPPSWKVVVEVVDSIRGGHKSSFLAAMVSVEENNNGHTVLPMTDELRAIFQSLEANIKTQIPHYMVPQLYVPLSGFPSTIAGKTDRKALRALGSQIASMDLMPYSISAKLDKEMPATELEASLQETWANILCLDKSDVGVNQSFYQLGGDSITVVSLSATIKKEYDVAVSVQSLANSQVTIRDLAAQIQHAKAGEVVEERKVDLLKEFDDCMEEITQDAERSRVFLTGTTGFLGTQILRQLLSLEHVKKVVLLVRAKTVEEGLKRVIEVAQENKWWRDEFATKIEIWTGDLAKPRFDLTAEQWINLSGSIDTIIHNGAIVNWIADFDTLKPANVNSTVQLLKIVNKSPATPRFVFVTGGASFENDILENREEISALLTKSNGYAQSKYLAEILVRQFATTPVAGDRVSVVKPSFLIGTQEEGVANTDDFFWRVVASAMEIGAYPIEEDNWLTISSTANVSATILNQVMGENVDTFIQVKNGLPVKEFWEMLVNELGYEMKPIEWTSWLGLMHQRLEVVGKNHVLWPVFQFLGQLGIAKRPTELEESQKVQIRTALKKNIEYLVGIGYLPNANGRRSRDSYNSAIVQSQGINGALTNIVTEDFFLGINTPDNVTNARWIGFKDTPYRDFVPAEELKYQTTGVWGFGRNTSYSYVADSLEMLRSRINGTKTAPDGSYYERLGQTECRKELLSGSSISTFSSSFLIANQSAFTNNASVIFYEVTYPAERYEVLRNETLRDLRIRQYLGLNQTDPVFDKFKREIGADFTWEVEYCLINKTPNVCRLEVSVPILIVTSICGLLKILCIGFTLYYLRGSGYKDIFLTIGDAISSFLTSHDRHTRDSAQKFISYSAFDKRRRAHWPLMKDSSTYDSENRSDRARFYASPNHWIFSIAVSLITGLIGAITFFNEFKPLGARSELFSWRDYAAEGYPRTGYNKFYLQILQINMPQLIISLIYILINATLTIVCMNEEFIRYGRRPGPLRLTEPKGKQKGTYFLSLPFRYAIPLQVIFTLLPWLFPQGLFYKRISFYDWFGRTNTSPSVSGIFARAGPIQIFFILFLAMILFLFFLAWTKYPGGAPIVGTSTAAISAACWGPEGSAIAESDTICYRVLKKAVASGGDDEEDTLAEPWTPWVPVEGRAAEKCGFTDDTSCPEIESGGRYM